MVREHVRHLRNQKTPDNQTRSPLPRMDYNRPRTMGHLVPLPRETLLPETIRSKLWKLACKNPESDTPKADD